MIIAVNGTLMKGHAANNLMIEACAEFVRDARTAPCYRLWNVANKHPAMMRDEQYGASISLELWEINPEKTIDLLGKEPPGLVLGRILLDDGSLVMGILSEPYILTGCEEITHYLGWREYQNVRNLGVQS